MIVGCGGVRQYWPGVGEAWAFFTPLVRCYPREALVFGRRLVEDIAERLQYKRIQATARVDFPQAASYLEHIGFEVESVMYSFTHDLQDSYMYARFF